MPTLLKDILEAGLLLALAIAGLWFIARTIYIWKESLTPLIPNCLLTRKPVFIICPQSPAWQFWNPEQIALRFLRNHGYQAQLILLDQASEHKMRPNGHFFASTSLKLHPALQHFPMNLSYLDFTDQKSILGEAIHRAEQDFI